MRSLAKALLWVLLIVVQLGAGLAMLGYLAVIGLGSQAPDHAGLMAVMSGATGAVAVFISWLTATALLGFLIAVLDWLEAIHAIVKEEASEAHRARRAIAGRGAAEARLRAELRGELPDESA